MGEYKDNPSVELLTSEYGQTIEETKAIENVYGLSPEQQLALASTFMSQKGIDKEAYREQLFYSYPDVFNMYAPRDFTDVGNAEVVERRNRGKMLFCDSLGWMVYDPKRGVWEANNHKAKGKCIDFTDEMYEQARKQFDDAYKEALETKYNADFSAKKDTGKVSISQEVAKFYSHALSSRSNNKINAMLELCKAKMNCTAALFDAAPYDLNTPAGIVDLRTGEIRPHDPKAYCTYMTACAPSQEGMQLWKDFLRLITCGDADLEEYLQINMGLSAMGKISTEYAVFSIGGGRNGKSTFYGAASLVMGDYAGTLDTNVIIKGTRENRFAFSNIRGKRLIVCPELEEGKTLSAEQIKRIASAEDPIDFEKKGKDLERLPRTFHLHLFSNYLPKVDSMDDGTWRRIKVVPFNAAMPTGKKVILNYASEVLVPQAGGAILQWIIDGAIKAYKCRGRFEDPKAVKEATEAYKSAEDWLETFINDRCIVDHGNERLRVQVGQLRGAWADYAKKYKYQNRSQAELDSAMITKGFEKKSIGKNRIAWIGIGLRDEDDRTEPQDKNDRGG